MINLICSNCNTNHVSSRSSRYCSECAAKISSSITGIPIKYESDPVSLSEKILNIIHSNIFKNSMLFVVVLCLLFAYGFFKTVKRHPPGITVLDSPVQETLEYAKVFEKEGYQIQALYKYKIKGKVLAFGNFFFTSAPKLSPYDITLGWQELSDQAIIDQIQFTHMPRYVSWNYSNDFALSHEYVNSHVSNNHIIPADRKISDILSDVRVGDIITLSGYLVYVSKDNMSWTSSTSRFDQGDGACEVMWVDRAEIS